MWNEIRLRVPNHLLCSTARQYRSLCISRICDLAISQYVPKTMNITAELQLRVHGFPKKIGKGTKIASETFTFGTPEALCPLDIMLVQICVTTAECYAVSNVLTDEETLKQMRSLIERLKRVTDSYEKQLKDYAHK